MRGAAFAPVRAARERGDGQALAEFALTLGIFLLVVGALIQLGLLVWTMNSINQIARDTARWAATQPTGPCDTAGNRTAVAGRADQLARQWVLMAYRGGTWTTATAFASVPASGVGVSWTDYATNFPTDCPPSDNQTAWFVQVRVNHTVPIFFPGLGIIAPTCGSAGYCISTTTEQRMEPKAP